MPRLKAHDIHNKKFKRSFIGYSIDEVNDYLGLIMADYMEQESNVGETLSRLSAQEIFNKKFKLSLFGYDMDEVNHFLDQIITDYEKQ